MLRFLSFLISAGFHVILCLVLLVQHQGDEIADLPNPTATPTPIPVQVDELPVETPLEEQEILEQEQEPLTRQAHYEVAQKQKKSSEKKQGPGTASDAQTEAMTGEVLQSELDRIPVPRLEITNLSESLVQQLIQNRYLIPVLELRDPLLSRKKYLIIKMDSQGYRCHPFSSQEKITISSRAIPFEQHVKNAIRNSIASSADYSQGRLHLYLSNRVDQLITAKQKTAVHKSGRPAQSAITFGHFVVAGGKLDFVIDQVK